jgi:hypothetical protein
MFQHFFLQLALDKKDDAAGRERPKYPSVLGPDPRIDQAFPVTSLPWHEGTPRRTQSLNVDSDPGSSSSNKGSSHGSEITTHVHAPDGFISLMPETHHRPETHPSHNPETSNTGVHPGSSSSGKRKRDDSGNVELESSGNLLKKGKGKQIPQAGGRIPTPEPIYVLKQPASGEPSSSPPKKRDSSLKLMQLAGPKIRRSKR